MLGKLKASLGIGAAKVDTVLESLSVTQGDLLKGTVHIKGGDVEQTIDAIQLKLCTEVKVEGENGVSYQDFSLGALQVVTPFVIQANETKQIPFELRLHDETPVTALNASKNQCHVWVETTLDIDFAIDPKDRDYLEILPLPAVAKVINAVQSAGFNMVKADVEKGYLNGGHFKSQSGCYQEIEFRGGGFLNKKEIELSFVLAGEQVHCLAEVERSLGLRGDQYVSFTLRKIASDAEVSAAVSRVLSI
ncbi:sporulation protein [Vibrio sp. LaRot3]|uniref:sporulation protein n=1 Tax=Vibrio sp. LaRot3 TaxID=2998829 RepID=UPI0022CE18DB|nr:sporulation protein [Vibrio sp. LaRot3]MDA0147687.1 sporulation protein [Vibrio sp. LaRot3]